MSYAVKEIFYSLQGEGARAGRPAVFCRFTGCNLWSGEEKHRAAADCSFCDTDFVGVDGAGGGKFDPVELLADTLSGYWPAGTGGKPYVIFTGGEPLLQLDDALIAAMHERGFEVAVETNGTLAAPQGIDWLCVSPKGANPVVQTFGNELKLVFILFIVFYTVMIFFSVGNSKLRLVMMPFFIIYCSYFLSQAAGRRLSLKKTVFNKWLLAIMIVFLCNGIYKYREIVLSPAEVNVRQIELCNELGFPKTAAYLLDMYKDVHYNKDQTSRLRSAAEISNALLETSE